MAAEKDAPAATHADRGDEITPAPAATNGDPLRDKATDFLATHGGGDTSFTYEEEKAVLRRIDLRVLPLLLGAYFFQQLDKSSLRFVFFPHPLMLLAVMPLGFL